MLYPIVVFTHGPVSSDSSFCIVNGFFIALGVEASDFAILMIAVHTALSIFNANPRIAAGEGGLYPYRKIAFALWIIFPVLMASLAFINDHPYVSAGTYCYLPVRPFWYRLALSWIPRYIIFAIIIIIYFAIYFYVNYKFKDFDRSTTPPEGTFEPGVQKSRKIGANAPLKRYSLPATPQLAHHGLLSDFKGESIASSERSQAGRKLSDGNFPDLYISTPRTSMGDGSRRIREHSDSWDTLTNLYPTNLHPTSIDIEPAAGNTTKDSHTKTASSSPTWSNFASKSPDKTTDSTTRNKSLLSFFSFLRNQSQHPALSSFTSTPISQLELVDSKGNNVAATEVQRTREKVRRQLRFMFIYPIVYITMWILPFVSHALQYKDTYALNPPYVLSAFVVVIINSQCAVDAWLFSTREQPWRHIPGTQGGFWESLRFWEAGWGLPDSINSRKRTRRGPGKSRAEMAAEARRAYKRRDEEMAAKRNEREETRDASRSWNEAQTSTERSWWDSGLMPRNATGMGTIMSTVAEEVSRADSTIQIPESVARRESIAARGERTLSEVTAVEERRTAGIVEPVSPRSVGRVSEIIDH